MSHHAVSAILLAVCAACAAPALRPLPTTVCHEARERVAGALPDGQLTRLLTTSHDRRGATCEAWLAAEPAAAPRCEGDPAPSAPRLFAIDPYVVARFTVVDGPLVFWMATHRRADGALAGPVALVLTTELGLEVQALGMHAGFAEGGVELRALRVADRYVVSIESGERSRHVDLLVQAGGALVAPLLETRGARCTSGARIPVREVHEEPLADGWLRRTQRSATIEAEGSAVVIVEHVTVEELDARQADAPPRSREDADLRRRLALSGARLRAERGALRAD